MRVHCLGFLLALSLAEGLRGKSEAIEDMDINPDVGDGIDAEEALALRQSPFQMAMSHDSSVTGTVEVTELDNVFYAFRGIRYAKASRWEEPRVLKSGWTQMESSPAAPGCPQKEREGLRTSEDCLWLNVFTPELSHLENPSLEAKYDVANGFLHEHKFSKHAVLVFLHPTGPNWDSGWAADGDYGPTHLLDYEVLLVTVNYRVGLLGFGNGKNLGLLDQVAALEWIQENIDRFGGDASKVTIMGHGTGAAAAHFHLLSPLSAGLFHSAISMSGSAFNFWALLRGGREQPMISAASAIPSNADVDSIVKMGEGLRIGPVIDGKFLPDEPEKIIASGKFQKKSQWLVGIVSEEGADAAKKLTDQNLSGLLSSYGFSPPNINSIINKYLKNKLGRPENFVSDALFNAEIDRAVRLMSLHSQRAVYYYRLNQPNATIAKTPLSHGEELLYLFPMTFTEPHQKDDEDQVFRKILLRMFSDFVRYGHPTVNTWNRQHLHHTYWRHFKPNRKEYIELKVNDIRMRENMFKGRLQFWNDILQSTPLLKTEL